MTVAALLIVAQLAFRGWVVSHAWFANDDFTWIQDAIRTDLSLDYLLHSHVGHLMPAGFLLTWINARVDPLNFVYPGLELLAFQLLASVGCLRLLRHLFGARWGILPPLLVFLAAPITLPAATWWAAGINQWPVILAVFFGLHSLVSFMRTQRTRYAVTTFLWTSSMLLFSEKVLVVYLVYGTVAVSYFATGHFIERCWQVWRKYKAVAIPHLLLMAAYVPFYLATSINFDPGTVDEQPLGKLSFNMVGEAFATGILGGPVEWWRFNVFAAVASPSDILVFLSWLTIGAVVLAGVRSRRNSLRGWAPLAATLFANVLLLATGRANIVGPVLGLEYRYQTEVAAVAALSLALAFLPVLGAVESAEKVRDHGFVDSRLYVSLIMAVVVVASTVSTVRFMGLEFRDRSPEVYYDNVARSIRVAEQRPIPMANLAVPPRIWTHLAHPKNLYDGMFAMYDDELRYPKISPDSLYAVDNAGVIRPVELDVVRRNVPAKRHECGYVVRRRDVTIPLDGPVFGFGWWLRVSYASNTRGPIEITVDSNTYRSRVEPGFHSLFVFGDGTYDSITIGGLERGRICVSEVVLGAVKPMTDHEQDG
jgi:hypothetical protein